MCMDKFRPSPDGHGRLLKLIIVTWEKPNLKDVVPGKVRANPLYANDRKQGGREGGTEI